LTAAADSAAAAATVTSLSVFLALPASSDDVDFSPVAYQCMQHQYVQQCTAGTQVPKQLFQACSLQISATSQLKTSSHHKS